MYSTLLLLALAGSLKAQNTTVNLILPFADKQSLVGSVINADNTATTYQIGCPGQMGGSMTGQMQKRQAATMTVTSAAALSSGSDSDDLGNANGSDDSNECGFISPVTVIEGPSTLHFSLAFAETTRIVDCKLASTTQAVCTGTETGASFSADSQNPAVETATLVGSLLPPPIPIVITAGADKLKSPSSSSASGSSSQAGKSSGASGTTAGAATPSGTSAATSPSSTGGNSGMHLEPGLAVGMAGALALGIAAVML